MNRSMELLEQGIVRVLKENSELRNDVFNRDIQKQDVLRDFAISVIDILDSYESIEASLQEREIDSVSEGKMAMSRFKAIHKRLLAVLSKYGVSRIEFPDGRLIVGFCEVVETDVDRERANDEIITVVRSGYIRGKTLIRPAQVIVVKN